MIKIARKRKKKLERRAKQKEAFVDFQREYKKRKREKFNEQLKGTPINKGDN